MNKKCLVCGKLFEKPNNCSLRNWIKRKYCSRECQKKSLIGRPTWNKGLKGITGPNKTSFKKGQVPWNKGVKGYMSGHKNNFWKGGQIIKQCVVCGKEFKVDLYRKDTAKCCGKKCSAISKKGKHFSLKTEFKRKEDSDKSINSRIRNTQQYVNWRKSIFSRDNYTCQYCGNRTMKGYKIILNAHHLIGFIKLLNIYNINTIDNALNCEGLWSMDCGITVCKKCHDIIHSNTT